MIRHLSTGISDIAQLLAPSHPPLSATRFWTREWEFLGFDPAEARTGKAEPARARDQAESSDES
ncbi:hypothetical protein [Acidomonas methanolica]|uniref:hypothetical protein n=1 Tax=Acidomonas methanolica TaxID=437 RepID=UPI002119E067|nr:hypothetical protein [Acidomonas methanolica]MCQ9155408.1 hypothetical protein [Acidomonas methanolica]